MSLLRLDKIIADTGRASRKEAKNLIKQSRVIVNGKPATSAEDKYEVDDIELIIDGERIIYSQFHYIMLNKPDGVLSATEDSSQKTVIDLLSPELQKVGLFPVGRLDKDTTGLILLTNDGDFAHRITSPKHSISKVYYAKLDGALNEDDVKAFSSGIVLKDGTKCLPAKLEILDGREDEANVIIYEGKYHQVKRMFASRGKHVMVLQRLAIGGLGLDDNLNPGEYRNLTNIEKTLIFT